MRVRKCKSIAEWRRATSSSSTRACACCSKSKQTHTYIEHVAPARSSAPRCHEFIKQIVKKIWSIFLISCGPHGRGIVLQTDRSMTRRAHEQARPQQRTTNSAAAHRQTPRSPRSAPQAQPLSALPHMSTSFVPPLSSTSSSASLPASAGLSTPDELSSLRSASTRESSSSSSYSSAHPARLSRLSSSSGSFSQKSLQSFRTVSLPGLFPGTHLGILASGLLDKRRDGAVRGGWAKRLFILSTKSLHYYRKAEDFELFGKERGQVRTGHSSDNDRSASRVLTLRVSFCLAMRVCGCAGAALRHGLRKARGARGRAVRSR